MKKGYMYIVISTILFSTMEITIKLVGSVFNPIQINFIRFLIGGLILLPIAIMRLKKSNTSINKHDIGFFAITGFLCIIISMSFFQLAVFYTKASTVAILFSCNPVFLLILNSMFFKEKLSKPIILSIIISVLGIIFIVNPFNLTDTAGIVLALISAITFAIYSLVCRYGTKKYSYDGIVLTSFTFILGCAELLVLIGITHINTVANFFVNINFPKFAYIPLFKGISLNTLAQVLYLGIGITGGGFCYYFLAMDEVGVVLSSLVFFIKPALAPIFALIILKEDIHINTVIGIIVILLGSVITFRENLNAQKRQCIIEEEIEIEIDEIDEEK